MNKKVSLPLFIGLLTVVSPYVYSETPVQAVQEKIQNVTGAALVVGAQVADYVGEKAHEAKEAVVKGALAAKIGIEQAKVSYETHRAEKAEHEAAKLQHHNAHLGKEIAALKEIIRSYDHEVVVLKERVIQLQREVASLTIERHEGESK